MRKRPSLYTLISLLTLENLKKKKEENRNYELVKAL